LVVIIAVNDIDYQYHYVAYNTTKKCIGARSVYVYV